MKLLESSIAERRQKYRQWFVDGNDLSGLELKEKTWVNSKESKLNNKK